MKKKTQKLQNLAFFFSFTACIDKLKFPQTSMSFKTENLHSGTLMKKPTTDQLPLFSVPHNNIQTPNTLSLTLRRSHKDYFDAV